VTVRIASFAPLQAPGARVLVLGSMPGVASLQAEQYYAHPRNAFWPIMEALCAVPAALPYTERVAALTRRGVAVWDVLKHCERQGSLDAAIIPASIETHAIADLLAMQPTIAAIACNGATAAALYRRHVLPQLSAQHAGLPLLRLPSTSPAHAALRFDDKLARWRTLQAYLR